MVGWGSVPETSDLIESALKRVADRNALTLSIRKTAAMQSFDLRRGPEKVFSFQIALRDVALESPLPTEWHPVRIETFADNVGAKMNALVQRGAPRDFLDIHELCRSRKIAFSECWSLWTRKNPGKSLEDARSAVALHLQRFEQSRPLNKITDPQIQGGGFCPQLLQTSLKRQPMIIDGTVYPDVPPPTLPWHQWEIADQADYVERVCRAWDFGAHPYPETFEHFRTERDLFDRFPISDSPAYHVFRRMFRWPEFPATLWLGTPTYVLLDRLEERTDPCEDRV